MKNMIKVRPWKLHKCLGSFNMLTVEGCSKTHLFRQLSNYAFGSLFFLKCLNLMETLEMDQQI